MFFTNGVPFIPNKFYFKATSLEGTEAEGLSAAGLVEYVPICVEPWVVIPALYMTWWHLLGILGHGT